MGNQSPDSEGEEIMAPPSALGQDTPITPRRSWRRSPATGTVVPMHHLHDAWSPQLRDSYQPPGCRSFPLLGSQPWFLVLRWDSLPLIISWTTSLPQTKHSEARF